MKRKWESAGEYSVEIWFRIEKNERGYPVSKNWEQLLARPLTESDACFQIESVPFYLKNISRGDIVKAKTVANPEIQEEEIFEFDEVLDRGGHNTYRLLLLKKHLEDPRFTENELLKKGLAVEEQHGDFFAVDVPPSLDQKEIDSYLVAESELGRWELQDGYLHSIRTTKQSDAGVAEY
jgi:Domain of unknown function (DUF4265)